MWAYAVQLPPEIQRPGIPNKNGKIYKAKTGGDPKKRRPEKGRLLLIIRPDLFLPNQPRLMLNLHHRHRARKAVLQQKLRNSFLHSY